MQARGMFGAQALVAWGALAAGGGEAHQVGSDGITTRASVGDAAQQANGSCFFGALSADGLHAAFTSTATNLGGSGAFLPDLYLRDRTTGATQLVGVSTQGVEANADTQSPSLSGDGRLVSFSSRATNLVPGDTNGVLDVFVRDVVAGTTVRASVGAAGEQGDGLSGDGVLSDDGALLAFASLAGNLVPGDANGASDVFVKDLATGGLVRASVSSSGAEANGPSARPWLSADGRFVAFQSDATNLVAGDTNGAQDVFVRDLLRGVTTRVSVATSGAQADLDCVAMDVSADGRHVLFASQATTLASGGPPFAFWDVFVHDRQTGVTTCVSVALDGEPGNFDSSTVGALSADGRHVAFASKASDLVANDLNGEDDVFVRDLQLGVTRLASVDSAGVQAARRSLFPSMSADARYVLFSNDGGDLVPGDTNQAYDIFVRDLGCGGEVETYCTAKPTSNGCLPAISFSGGPSAEAGAGFVLRADQVHPGAPGLLFYSTTGPASAPFLGGYLCAQPPLTRVGQQVASGSGPCGGQLAVDFNVHVASDADPALQVGASFWAQFWSRDAGDPFGSSLSNAVRATLCP